MLILMTICVYCTSICSASVFISNWFGRPSFTFGSVVDKLHGSDVSECVLGVVCMGAFIR